MTEHPPLTDTRGHQTHTNTHPHDGHTLKMLTDQSTASNVSNNQSTFAVYPAVHSVAAWGGISMSATSWFAMLMDAEHLSDEKSVKVD